LDAHGKVANPSFVDLNTLDFKLTSSSPALGLGENLGETDIGFVDYGGGMRVVDGRVDAGAYEF
jgi:hypothetical protein